MDNLKFLVVEGYAKEGREDLRQGGASLASELYAKMLKRWAPGAEVEVVMPADPGASLPLGASISQYDGIAWTGSSLTIHKTDDPRVIPQVEFAKSAFEAGVPGFGSCWALQVAVVAAGGICQENPKGREMGIARKIALTPEGRAHPLYQGKKSVFDAFISHDDEITHMAPGAVRLSGNDFTQVQSATVTHRGGIFWALQYHPEYDLHELARLCYCRKQKLTDKGFFRDTDAAQAFVDQLEALHQNPARKDISWLLGIDEDVMNEDIRQAEVRNWIEQLVIPTKSQRS